VRARKRLLAFPIRKLNCLALSWMPACLCFETIGIDLKGTTKKCKRLCATWRKRTCIPAVQLHPASCASQSRRGCDLPICSVEQIDRKDRRLGDSLLERVEGDGHHGDAAVGDLGVAHRRRVAAGVSEIGFSFEKKGTKKKGKCLEKNWTYSKNVVVMRPFVSQNMHKKF